MKIVVHFRYDETKVQFDSAGIYSTDDISACLASINLALMRIVDWFSDDLISEAWIEVGDGKKKLVLSPLPPELLQDE